jgi:hypothetical protein
MRIPNSLSITCQILAKVVAQVARKTRRAAAYDDEYTIEVFASIIGKKKAERLSTLTFSIASERAAEVIQIPQRDLYLLWNADTRRYDAHVRHDNEPMEVEALGIDVNGALANLYTYKPVKQ